MDVQPPPPPLTMRYTFRDPGDPFQPLYRSTTSSVKVRLVITNPTNIDVVPQWMDYSGEEHNYPKVEGQRTRRHFTYLTHPWVMRHSRRSYMLNFDVFRVTSSEFGQLLENNTYNPRTLIAENANLLMPSKHSHRQLLVLRIKPTVPTLTELCYIKIFRDLKRKKQPAASLQPSLPLHMVDMLHNFIANKHSIIPHLMKLAVETPLTVEDYLTGCVILEYGEGPNNNNNNNDNNNNNNRNNRYNRNNHNENNVQAYRTRYIRVFQNGHGTPYYRLSYRRTRSRDRFHR